MTLTSEEGSNPNPGGQDAVIPEMPQNEEVLDSEGRRIEKFCPKCYLFRTPKENYCIVCGTKLKEIKVKPRKK
jgi:hypothetical protein